MLISILAAGTYYYTYRDVVKVTPSFIKTGETIVIQNTCGGGGKMELIAEKGIEIHSDYYGYERKSVDYNFGFKFDKYSDRSNMVFNNIFYDYYTIYGRTEIKLNLHGSNNLEGYFILQDENTPYDLEGEITKIIHNGTDQCQNTPNYVHFVDKSEVTVKILASKPSRVSMVFYCKNCVNNKVTGNLKVNTFYPIPSEFVEINKKTYSSIIHQFDNFTVLNVPKSDSTNRYIYSTYCI